MRGVTVLKLVVAVYTCEIDYCGDGISLYNSASVGKSVVLLIRERIGGIEECYVINSDLVLGEVLDADSYHWSVGCTNGHNLHTISKSESNTSNASNSGEIARLLTGLNQSRSNISVVVITSTLVIIGTVTGDEMWVSPASSLIALT